MKTDLSPLDPQPLRGWLGRTAASGENVRVPLRDCVSMEEEVVLLSSLQLVTSDRWSGDGSGLVSEESSENEQLLPSSSSPSPGVAR